MSEKRNTGRDTFSGVEIEYLGGIESIEKQESITGSCTLFTARDLKGNTIKIVIDAGMHQGGKNDSQKNAFLDQRVLEADYLIITHAHIDHIGKIPYLVKNGFKGLIYMSPITKTIAIPSLRDSARVMQKEYEEQIEKNKKLGPILKAIIQLKQISEKLRNNGLKKQEKSKLESQKSKIESQFPQKERDKYDIKYPNIRVESEIKDILTPTTLPLYTEEDVLYIVDKISVLDVGEEIKLSHQKGTKISDLISVPTIDGVSLSFQNAGHIAGSVQAEISIRVKRILDTSQILSPEEQTSAVKNFLFTGDLGRSDTGNISGVPQASSRKIDYIQVESTYAGRNHRERQEAQKELIEIITSAPGKVIIPTFAIQRSQEILLLLLRHYETNIFPKIVEKRQAISESSDSQEKQKLRQEIGALHLNIVLDSPLATSMKDIYVNDVGGDFSLLDEDIQNQKFGRPLIQVLEERKDYESLYLGKSADIKHIILSSGGMCEGGAVISHLKKNLDNPKSSIAFVGYTPPSTLGGKIKQDNSVIIDGKIYQIEANIHDISGFSGHIGHDEIISYVNNDTKIAIGGIIAFTHGGENRRLLKQQIKKPRGGKITLPHIGDTFQVAF